LLIFKNIEQLKRLVLNADEPVQFVFAGKAHPADKAGADMIREIVRLSKDEEFLGRLIFLENYDIDIARLLVSGVDVWLNNPIRYQEASGTSGIKASINGVVNCSIPDGWWDEAYTGGNGFVIGRGTVYENPETQDLVDSGNLYSMLDERIAPLYYKRDSRQVPSGWVRMMKNAIASVAPVFNTHRMVTEYVSKMYEPAAARSRELAADNYRKAAAIAEWKRKCAARFATLHIRSMQVEGIQGDIANLGDEISLRVTVEKGDLSPDEILPEMVVQDTRETGSESIRFIGKMELADSEKGLLTYKSTFRPDRNGKFTYGVRITPYHEYLGTKYETGLVLWS
jgi:phosphorylase/glycogen(starch) synthase